MSSETASMNKLSQLRNCSFFGFLCKKEKNFSDIKTFKRKRCFNE